MPADRENETPINPQSTRLKKSLAALDGKTAPDLLPPAGAVEPVPEETGGPDGPEPTRYGDWERKGRCIDF